MQVVAALEGVATTIPVGNVSENERFVAVTGLVLLSMLKVRVLVPFRVITAGANAFENPGAATTVRVAVAVPLDPDDDVSAPVVLTWEPGDTPMTST